MIDEPRADRPDDQEKEYKQAIGPKDYAYSKCTCDSS